jgi:cytidylate kinase
MGHCSPSEFPFCDNDCEAEFRRVVDGIESRMPLEMLRVKPGSRLWVEAEKEIMARRVRDYTQRRDYAELEYERERRQRRPFKSLYPC